MKKEEIIKLLSEQIEDDDKIYFIRNRDVVGELKVKRIRLNTGFNAWELLGILLEAQDEILKQMRGVLTPKVLDIETERIVTKELEEKLKNKGVN